MIHLSEAMVKKYRRQIKNYEKKLANEFAFQGFYRDGGGLRYYIGILYVLINDIEDALKAYNWFAKNFPDDWGEPVHSLTWALALYRNGDLKKAAQKLFQTMFKNIYLLEYLIGLDIKPHDIWHASNTEDPEYIDYVPEEYLEMWENTEIDWARTQFNSPIFQKYYKRYLEIYHELKTEKPGPKRTQLVEEVCNFDDLEIDFEA